VVSYEPMPKSFQVLQKNIVENGYATRVDARQVACSHATGQVAVASVAGMYVVDSAAGAQSIECVRLDQEELPEPDIIKIDVEGHEPAVLRGLAGVLGARDPIIVLQLNEYWLRRRGGFSGQ
jgi:FkbM family methyltransferase